MRMIGVDEVGRGCLAGPLLVVAARQKTVLPPGVRDSKLLTRDRRQQLFNFLVKSCDFGEGWVSPAEIDKCGMAGSMKLGVSRALQKLGADTNDKIILDGLVNYLPKAFKLYDCLINADERIPLVSAASVYAKVVRDRFMAELSVKYPRYGFESHVGYGTAKHRAALSKLGPLANVHRFSFRGVGL